MKCASSDVGGRIVWIKRRMRGAVVGHRSHQRIEAVVEVPSVADTICCSFEESLLYQPSTVAVVPMTSSSRSLPTCFSQIFDGKMSTAPARPSSPDAPLLLIIPLMMVS